MHTLLRAALLLGCLASTGAVGARAQTLVSAVAVGGTGDAQVRAVALDEAGALYVVGTFQGTHDFDPGPEVVSRSSAGSNDVFVLSLDALGAFRWLQTFGGPALDGADGVAVHDGRVYVAASFEGTVDLDAGSGGGVLTSDGGADAVLAAYDAASGALEWAAPVSGPGIAFGAGVAIEGETVAFVGSFTESVDFDPGTGTAIATSGGNLDGFVAAYASADGAFSWGVPLAGAAVGEARGVALGGERVFVTGSFEGDLDLGGGTPVGSAGEADAFLAAYGRADGALLWGGAIGGSGSDVGYAIGSGADAVYLAAGFEETVDIDPGAGTTPLVSAGLSDALLAAYGPSDGALRWSAVVTGPSSNIARGVAAARDRVVVVGGFQESAALGTSGPTLTAEASTDGFLAAFTTAGELAWGGALNGPRFEQGQAAATNGSEVAFGGVFQSTVDPDLGPDAAPVSGGDGFFSGVAAVYTIDRESAAVPFPAGPGRIVAWPNPTPGPVALDAPAPIEGVEVLDALGRRVHGWAERSRSGARIRLDLRGLPPGVYAVRLTTASGAAVQRVTVLR